MFNDYGYVEENALGKPYDARLLRRMLPFARPYARLFGLAIVMVLVITGLELSLPYITKVAVDRYIVPGTGRSAHTAVPELTVSMRDPEAAAVVRRHPDRFTIENGQARIEYRHLTGLSAVELARLRHRDLAGVGRMTALLLLVVILSFIFNFIQEQVMETAGQRIMHDMRMGLYRHIQSLPIAFFSQNPVGRLVTRATNDVQNLNELFTSIITVLFKDIALLAGIAVMLLFLDKRLALACFGVLPLVVVAATFFSRRSRQAFRDLRILLATINTRFSETIGGIKIIQLFREEAANADGFHRINRDYYAAGMTQVHVSALFLPVIEILAAAALAVVIWYGGGRVLLGRVSLGALVAFISYVGMFFQPIRDIAEKYNILQNAMASAERIVHILDTPGDAPPSPLTTARPDRGRPPEIQFESVDFSYTADAPVLTRVSLTVPAGRTVAIVGPTGAGKTTLIQLLTRFYAPTAGRIRYDGTDIATLDITDLRGRMALVMQEPFVFSDTLAANILLDGATAPPAALDRWIDAARCRPISDRLPQGPATILAEGGRSLSSGERQLIAIARAIARNPDLILLDEATSHIDSETEARIQQALDHLLAGRTAIVVAHRMSTARRADRIVVMNHGRIVEEGTHPELMARAGFYSALTRLG